MGFRDAFALAADVPGWLTEAQARVLFDAAADVRPGGRIVEIGSHHGRSTILLASGARGATVTAVDPFPGDWRYGGPDTEARFRANTARAGVAGRIDLRVASSADARAAWTGPVDLVYIDGKHDYWTVRDDLAWVVAVPEGGTVLVHDAFSSLGVTLALLRDVLPSRRLRYAGRTGSLARLEVALPRPADRLRILGELPWWGRNLLVKVLLRLRWRRPARLLGHDDTADPY